MYFDFCKPSEDEAVSCNNRDRDCGSGSRDRNSFGNCGEQ